MSITEEQFKRYNRHIILKGFGSEGQEKLAKSRVLVIGSGGLGSPAILYLAAAGIGYLGIMDGDVIDLSNLQRQIIHSTPGLDKSKVTSATERINDLNPDVTVVPIGKFATADNIMEIIDAYDFVIDGTDNFASKFLINDACVLAGKPFVHAGILGFQGQLLTVLPGKSACYRCVYPEPPTEGSVPTCKEVGVLGPVPGVLGSMQAAECIKFILGIGSLMDGKLLVYDALYPSFNFISVNRDPRCPVCGEHPTITAPQDLR